MCTTGTSAAICKTDGQKEHVQCTSAVACATCTKAVSSSTAEASASC